MPLKFQSLAEEALITTKHMFMIRTSSRELLPRVLTIAF